MDLRPGPRPVEAGLDWASETDDDVTNTATVTGGGDTATHTDTDPTTIKHHEHHEHDEHDESDMRCDHREHWWSNPGSDGAKHRPPARWPVLLAVR